MPFKIESFQNRHLSPGQTRVDGIVQVTAPADAQGAAGGGQLVVGFIIDKSGSMAGERIESVVKAVSAAIEMLDDRAWFFVVAFDAVATVVVPPKQATRTNQLQAEAALEGISADHGTAMSTGLRAARQLFEKAPNAIRHALFLTDGKNESEQAGMVVDELGRCDGIFECDCWGVGTDWHVGEVQLIAQSLMGKASLIPEPTGVAAAFRSTIQKASAKALKDVRLRIWTPQGAKVVFAKQVNPTIEELTSKGRQISPQIVEYATGAWGGAESRDFHVAIEVKPGKVGDEMLAARPSVIYLESDPANASGGGWSEREEKAPEARLFANWTGDDSLSSRIDHHVAHYTGQGELAVAIQNGLELREKGQEAAATQLLGRAVKLAHESKNADMTQRLSKVVEVLDASTGTVRLKKDVKKAATMELQLESRTTKRVGKGKADPGAGGSTPAP